MSDEDMELHYGTIIGALNGGDIVPFLGAGANLCDRPVDAGFTAGVYLPNGAELAEHLAENFGYTTLERKELSWVAQYITVAGLGTAALKRELRAVFGYTYAPSLLHKLLAVLPRACRDRNRKAPFRIIVTTNYDDVLERAFFAARESFDVVSYVADGACIGKFRHWSYVFKPTRPAPTMKSHQEGQSEAEQEKLKQDYLQLRAEYDEEQRLAAEEFWEKWPPRIDPPQVIITPNDYSGFSLSDRVVIFKIHGAADRNSSGAATENECLDSFVITEDDYIEYLARTDVSGMVPALLAAELRSRNFWFLGYSLRDWNLRVMLRRLWGEHSGHNSWAILRDPESLEKKTWIKRNVEILDKPLHEYVCDLTFKLQLGPYLKELDQRLADLS